MTRGDEAARLLVGFVEKSGGIEKLQRLYGALRTIPPDEVADYMRRAVRTDGGARQLFACALAGVSLTIHLHGPLSRAIAEQESDA